MSKDKVLVIGSGGREHTLGWKIAQSPEVSEVLYAPGNAGTGQEFKGRNIPLDATKKDRWETLDLLINSEKVDLTVVGPDNPLAEGIVDFLTAKGHRVFGPTKEAAKLESDKFFSYELMKDLGIPQAGSVECYTINDAIKAINDKATDEGIVLKARGLALGKGVIVCDSKEQALASLENHIKSYGSELLVAERLFGQEFSIFGISNGEKFFPIEMSFQDHKPIFDGDKGPNTGGMGAYGPAPIAPSDVVRYVTDNFVTPIIQEMKRKGKRYSGFVYGGLMMTEDGPKVLEWNARFGDPEAQPAMVMLESDLYHPLLLTAEEKLEDFIFKYKEGAAVCVVLASQGYPGDYKKGLEISGLEEAAKIENVKVFHAGTKMSDGKIVTSGGRVLGVTAYSADGIAPAQKLAYEAASRINIPGGFSYRKDIGKKALGGM